MNEELQRAIHELLKSPHQLHAAIVHLPIAAAIFGSLTFLGLLFAGGNNDTLRRVTVVIFLIGAGAGFAAQITGRDAMMTLQPVANELTDAASDDLSNHEELGEKIWIAMGVCAFLVALSTIERPAFRATALTFATFAVIVTVVGVTVAAHFGGQLVYRHGAGVPDSSNNDTTAYTAATTAPATQPAKPN